MVARMEQTRSRLARWRVAILAVLLVASLVALVPIAIIAFYQDRQFMAAGVAFRSGDYATALREWRPLAEHGHVKAQHNLGSMYYDGQGVPKNNAEAVRWIRKAAEQGLAKAQSNLGLMYGRGHGVPRDYANAVKWYRKAANQGRATAQSNLGYMYARGQGVPQDYVRAHMWFSLAATQGLKRAVGLRNDFAKKLTPAQLTEAQQLARVWLEEHGQANAAQRSIANTINGAAVAADTILANIVGLVPPLKSAPAIVGTWQSAPVLGQLGLIQVTLTFNEDGSVTSKADFISFPTVSPEMEYFWDVSKGTYSIDRNEVTVNFGRTWAVLKKRGEDETIGPKQGTRSTQVFHLEEGKLVTEDSVLVRLEEVDPGELAAWKSIADSSERTDFERFLKDYPDGRFTDQAKDRFAALVPTPSPAPAGTSVQPAVGVYPKTNEEIGFTLTQTFLNPTPGVGDGFGDSVAISGDKVLLGAWLDAAGAIINSGAAYLFDVGTGNLLHTFLNPTPAPGDIFGDSVAISGDKVLIGAGWADDAGAKKSGAAYLFDAGTGNLLQTFLNPTPGVGDGFGTSVAISGDKVLIGAWGDDAGAKDSGAANLFDAVTGNLLHTFLNPSPAASDEFGGSVAISGDKVLIGASGDDAGAKDSGAAYLYLPVPTSRR